MSTYRSDAADRWLALAEKGNALDQHGIPVSADRAIELATIRPTMTQRDHWRAREGQPLKRARKAREAAQEADGLGPGGSYVPPALRRTFTNAEWREVQAAKDDWQDDQAIYEAQWQAVANDGLSRIRAEWRGR